MNLQDVTPLILTFNEAPNIGRILDHLAWAKRIVVVDSYSTDSTINILKLHPQVEIFQRQFDTHANQWNYGLAQVQTEWVLSLDADYIVPEALVSEINTLSNASEVDSYSIRFKYCVFGKPLRGTILPPRQALFRRQKATYIDDGHTQVLQVSGQYAMLDSYFHHDDRKPLSRWLWAQDRYMALEVKKLLSTPEQELSLGDRIRKSKILAPLVILIYCLFLKGGILDGWAGWYYAFQRVLAEILLSIHLIEAEVSSQKQ
ncbi:glycosyltransferase family 2 protein [Myxacorys almedinensis]|uniref:Glycosyltransferase n=1 Tax=Myxacorys almedinensis A TaxID=2690445 RepID=A0A8J8CKL1_9CYAN|nr:glycosyltransferase family 2 protein [Myxacorys almedinensis]NDJ18726.1 glycosyltransferase [Myxacorys almedinensis A]